MTDTFDWAGLWQGAEAAKHDCMFCDCDAPNEAAAAYLRTRIEAAFVPRKQPLHCETCGTDVAEVLCAKCGKWWRDNSPEVHEATARAEAAEARVAELTAQLAEARESERAAVVAWLQAASARADNSPQANAYGYAAEIIKVEGHLK